MPQDQKLRASLDRVRLMRKHFAECAEIEGASPILRETNLALADALTDVTDMAAAFLFLGKPGAYRPLFPDETESEA